VEASKRHAKLQELYDLAQGSEEFDGGGRLEETRVALGQCRPGGVVT